ncbi:ATP-binding protein [Magnetofaba australis]|uniref:ATP-binding protein n=1 Tax=Magnetofaba australis TaxID=1472297 RepID=UPI000A19B66F|nr:ATP-binding protein [Magnetofaba australis]
MADTRKLKLAIREEEDISRSRRAAFGLMAAVAFSPAEQTRFATAISELTRNIIKYAFDGECALATYADDRKKRIEAWVQDRGPGIADLKQALERGFSTSGTLGHGLNGARDLVDGFRIESSPSGTRVWIMMERSR